jgi:outer membrane immunogenic protein
MKLRALLHACAFAGLAVLLPSTITLAADFPPTVPPVRTPVPVVAAPYSWYGFYIGIQGGYGFGGKAIEYAPNASYATLFASGAVPGPVVDDPRGFVGGVTYGTNFQFGSIVLGTESDWSYSDVKRSETLGPLPGFSTRVTAEQHLKYFSTTRARAGLLMSDHWLVYGTGGLASGGVESSSSFNLVAPAACAGAGNCPGGSRSKTLWGWAAGGGLEFANGPWSLKVEYLYYDLGNLNYTVADPSLPGGAITASNKVSGSIVRGGLNYRFNWTLFDLVLGRR